MTGPLGHKRTGMAETAALLMLCLLFFVLAVATIITGVSAYNNTVRRTEETNTYRTALAYITNQVRQGDAAGGIQAARLFGGDALFIPDPDNAYSEYQYGTYIYVYGGYLRELYTELGLEGELTPESGVELVSADTASFTQASEGLIQATVRCGQKSGSVMLYLKSGEVASQ